MNAKSFFWLFITLIYGISCLDKKTPSKKTILFISNQFSKQFGIAQSEQPAITLFYINNKDTIWISQPAKPFDKLKIIVLSTVFSSYFSELNAQHHTYGVDDKNFYYDTVLLQQLKNGNSNEYAKNGNIDEERLLLSGADILIGTSFNNFSSAFKTRLEKSGIQLIVCDNYTEQHPLARAEWIRFFGALINKLSAADSIFNQISINYSEIKNQTPLPNKPVVMIESIFSGVWNVSGGNSYTAKLIKDAGGKYVFEQDSALFSYAFNLETVLKKASNSDIWLHPGVFLNAKSMLAEEKRYAFFKPMRTKQIFNNNQRVTKRGGNDFWEKGVVRPDLILKDLSRIFRNQTDSLFFYRKVD